MENRKNNKIHKYFAAANTYSGFKSFFDEIFRPEDYERIFVIKGGPGTGKSSFMKRISEEFLKSYYEIEHIHCSSDPASLDGIIISKNNKKIALLDGTAPHERDAKIPGAFDEIINLAEGLDIRILSAQKDEILSLQKEKAKAYKTAYFYLGAAGKSEEIISETYKENFDIFGAKSKAEAILSDVLTSNCSCISTRLVSSFGRQGSVYLDTLSTHPKRTILVGGNDITASMFLACCFDILKTKKVPIIHLPFALDPSRTDALFLPESNLAIIRGEGGEINAADFVKIPPLDEERIKTARFIHSSCLEEARRWFSIASDIHFRLEKIYGDAMNFEKNDKIFDEKINQIADIFEKEI